MTAEEFKDIWVTPPSSTLAWLHLLWLANLWTTQGGPYWKDCPTQWRYARGIAHKWLHMQLGDPPPPPWVQALVKCCRTCIYCNGHNDEKWQSCNKFLCSKLAANMHFKLSSWLTIIQVSCLKYFSLSGLFNLFTIVQNYFVNRHRNKWPYEDFVHITRNCSLEHTQQQIHTICIICHEHLSLCPTPHTSLNRCLCFLSHPSFKNQWLI
jgi:hypothetical protein